MSSYGDHGVAFPSTGGEASNNQVIFGMAGGGAYVLRPSSDLNGTLAYLTRLLPNGAVDQSFGRGAVTVSAAFDATQPSYLSATPDGGVVIEFEENEVVGESSNDLNLKRFSANGAVDTSFGNGGIAGENGRIEPGGDYDTLSPGPLAIEGDGSILWSSWDTVPGSNVPDDDSTTFGTVSRLSAVGAPIAFGKNLLDTVPTATLVGPNGRVFVVGISAFQSGLGVRPAPNYLSVETYNGNGKLRSGPVELVQSIPESNDLFGAVVDSKGRITMDGVIDGKARMIRFFASGKVDRTFGIDGEVSLNGLSFTGTESNNLLREPDGSFLIGGYATPKSGHGARAAVQHYSASGVFDPKYGSAGLGILTSTKGLLVGDAKTLVAGPNRSILVSTTLRDTVGKASRQRLVVDDIAAG